MRIAEWLVVRKEEARIRSLKTSVTDEVRI